MTRKEQKEARKIQIIEATLDLFVERGYYGTKTSQISRRAGISEGLLFHYFVNKLGLYTFLYDYSVRFMLLELSGCMGGEEDDFFELIRKKESAKMQVLKNYPYMQLFLDSVRYENVKEALYATEEKRNVLSEAEEVLMKQADMTRFKPEVDVKKLDHMIDYTLKGIMEDRFLENSFHPDMLHEEVRSYLDMLKKLTYR